MLVSGIQAKNNLALGNVYSLFSLFLSYFLASKTLLSVLTFEKTKEIIRSVCQVFMDFKIKGEKIIVFDLSWENCLCNR